MLWVDRSIAVLLIAAAVPLWLESNGFPGNGEVFPQATLGALIVLAVALFVRTLVPAARQVSDFLGSREPKAIARAVAVFVLAVVAVLTMGYIGFFAAMLGFCLLLYPLLRVSSWRLYAGAIALLLAFVYVIFVFFLNVPLTADRML